MKTTLKLLNSYYLKGFFGPFFVVVFPILILFIVGNAMIGTAESTAAASHGEITAMGFMKNFVSGILITTVISTGLMGLPVMIIEFKKSTLIKRIGAAHISKTTFFLSALFYQLAWSVFSIFWVLLWAGIIIGTKDGFNWSVAFDTNFFIAIPFMAIAMLISISIGLLVVAVSKTQQAVMGITNVIYLPISFLSGGFLPKEQIDSSEALKGISWILPTKYAVEPFFKAFNGGIKGLEDMGWQAYVYPIIAISMAILFISVVVKKFKWTN